VGCYQVDGTYRKLLEWMVMKIVIQKVAKAITGLGLLPYILPPEVAYAAGCTNTTLGCIPSDPHALVEWFFRNALKLAAVCTVILLIIGGYEFIGSTGDPEKLATAKTRITAALGGLFFILVAVVIFRIMGVDILGIEDWIF